MEFRHFTALAVAIMLGASVTPVPARAERPAAAADPTEATISPSLRRTAEHSIPGIQRAGGVSGMDRAGPLRLLRVFREDKGDIVVHWQSTVGGIPVWGGDFIAQLDSRGEVRSLIPPRVPRLRRGDLQDDGGDASALIAGAQVPTQPLMNEDQAIAVARRAWNCPGCETAAPKTDLWVMVVDEAPHLVWRVRMWRLDGSRDTQMPVAFVDGMDGSMIGWYENLQTAQGTSLYSGTVDIETSFSSSVGQHYMEDLARQVGTFDYRNGTSSAYRFVDSDDVWNTATQRAAVEAHYAAEHYMDFLGRLGRDGIDGSGGPGYYTSAQGAVPLISNLVHYSSSYNNAFWNGQYMTYGDGDGTTFSPLVTIDIVGHEMTHGVTERTAGLVYMGESGALNESISDVFGALLERDVRGESAATWKIGEEAYTPGVAGDALRYMDNPHQAGNYGYTSDDDPDHYSERYTGSGDNGGVHINSGIANKAFYLLAKGGTHHRGGSMTGIGADDAGRIWFKALTSYMTSSTNFAGARTATVNAANALFGATSTQALATAQSWCLVGVGSCSGGGTTGTTELVSNGGFEKSISPWVSAGSGALYTSVGNYPHGGSGYVYFGGANSVTGQTYQQITIPSTATAALTFWLNVSSAETTTSTQYDRLFVEVRNTSGTLLATLATYSNLNKGTIGTYVQRSLSLAAYKGQTIRLQFRATTDSSLVTTFRVDDVSVK